MRRLKKNIYLGAWATLLLGLAVVRQCLPGVMGDGTVEKDAGCEVQEECAMQDDRQPAVQPSRPLPPDSSPSARKKPHPIRGVHSYKDCFPDVQDVQIVAARKWGVPPVRDREQAEHRKAELVYVGSNPYYMMDKSMSFSIPYLVPRAADLLQQIGHSFMDSLAVKGVPLHRIIVTSVLRSENDVARLRKRNGNATEQSCHRFGTTFDIAYNRYHTVAPPGVHRRAVRDDTLKYVLSEVLRDIRQQHRCYVRYEVKQGCFHITTR